MEDRSDSVAEVRTEQGHRNDVENRYKRVLKSVDDHFPGAGLAERSKIRVDANGKVKEVEDDKGQNCEARPDHYSR